MKAVVDPERGNEEALIQAARKGDARAFESLYRMHVGRIHALCLRMTADRQWAEDCTQEAFVRAWEKLDLFEGRSAFSTWLHRIAINEVLSRRRREKRHQTHLSSADVYEDMLRKTGVDQSTGLGMDLEDAVSLLPEGARDVFVLCAVNGCSHEETAGLLGIAVGTSKAQLHRAKKLLRQRLET
ncbi:MAG: RNA polymerase sigma factor [Gammaproteobacteria bacterium]